MIYNFLPFMILPIYTVLSKIDKQYLEAASDLGANKTRTFFKIILPLSIPGVVSGITMVFLLAVSTFVISGLLGEARRPYRRSDRTAVHVGGNWHFGSSLPLS